MRMLHEYNMRYAFPVTHTHTHYVYIYIYVMEQNKADGMSIV